MRSTETEPAVSATLQPAGGADSQFEVAHRQLRLALIQAIARRVGKSLEPVSINEAASETPLAELYQRKLHGTRFSRVVERLLFRWWR
jgi:hypothetical protein